MRHHVLLKLGIGLGLCFLAYACGRHRYPATIPPYVPYVHVMFRQSSRIYYVRSTDSGSSFGTPYTVDAPPPIATLFTGGISLDSSDNPQITFQQHAGGVNPRRVYFNRSTDKGASFAGAYTIDANTGNDAFLPSQVTDSAGNVQLVFQEGGTTDLYYNHTTNEGASFVGASQLDNIVLNFINGQAIAVDSNRNPHVAMIQNDFANDRAYYLRSSDGGTTFTAPLTIDNGPGNNASSPAVGTNSAGTVVHVFFVQSNGVNNRGYYVRSTNSGTSFSAPTIVDSGTAQNVTNNQLRITSSGNPHIAFLQSDGTNARAYYRRSTDGGATFGTSVALDAGSTNPATALTLALDNSDNPHLMFSQSDGTASRCYYNHSTDGGASFSGPITVDSGPGRTCALGTFSLDNAGNPHVVMIQTDGTYNRIYYNYSNVGGRVFLGTKIIDAGTGLAASSPKIIAR